MIFLDASETRTNTTMPDIEGVVSIPDLEALTGADMMLSLMKAPAITEVLIKRHVANGAILVQRKHGRDLSSSVGERMNKSLAKMIEVGTRCPYQRVLLHVGIMTCSSGDKAVINKQQSRKQWVSVQSAISKWRGRGGTFEYISRATLLERWCNIQLRQMQEFKDKPVKKFMAAKPLVQELDDFLQVLVPVNDGRVLLACLPGIGAKMTSVLHNEFEHVYEALCWLTEPTNATTGKRIKGVGVKTIENVRGYLELDDPFRLSVEPSPFLLEQWENRNE